MNQTAAYSLFAASLAGFIALVGQLVTEQTSWAHFGTPLGALHGAAMVVSFCVLVTCALHIQLPRTNQPHGDRIDDPKEPK